MLPNEDDADMLDDDDIIRDVDDLEEDAEEAEGIDLFADDFENDYAARENDAYEGQGIDDEGEYEELSLAERRKLDASLNARDREARRRMPAAFLPDDDEQDGLAGLMGRRRVRRHRYDEEDDMDMGIPLVMEATPNGDRFELQVHYLPAKVPDELVPVIADAFAASLVACMRFPSSSIDYLGEFNVAELAAKLAVADTSSVEHEADISQDGDHVPWTDEERLIREAFAGLAGLDLSRVTKHTSL